MDDGCAGYVDTPALERRRAALIAFLGAGMYSPPSKALIVEVLAGARRAVALHQPHGRALDEWLAGEVRLRGIRENAAVLAVLELLPGRREEAARAYRGEHPDSAGVLGDLRAVLDQPVAPRALGCLRFQVQAVWARNPCQGLSWRVLVAETGPVTGRLWVREIDDDEGRRLVRIIRRGSGSVVTWRRAQMVLLPAQGMDAAAIAKVAFTSEDRVRDVIRNFNADGFASLYPKYKGGHPPKFTLAQRREIKKIARAKPAEYDLPFSTWSLAKLADFLVAEGVVDDISHEGLRALLRQEGVTFQRMKTWKASKDPCYAAKKARIEHLYAIADREAVPRAGDPEAIFCVDLCRHRNYAEGLRCRF